MFGGKSDTQNQIKQVIDKTKNKNSKFDTGFGIVSEDALNMDLEKKFDENQQLKKKIKEKMHAQKSHQQSNQIGKEETKGPANDHDPHNQLNLGSARKMFGPSTKQIKNQLNKKLRKKFKQQEQQELKQLKNRIEENEKNVYDFLKDFSSSDYETVSEEELEREQERERNLRNNLNISSSQRGFGDNTSFMSRSEMTEVSERRLIDAFRKFEKRKIPSKPKPYSTYQKPLYLPDFEMKRFAKDRLFEGLKLRRKIQEIFDEDQMERDQMDSESSEESSDSRASSAMGGQSRASSKRREQMNKNFLNQQTNMQLPGFSSKMSDGSQSSKRSNLGDEKFDKRTFTKRSTKRFADMKYDRDKTTTRVENLKDKIDKQLKFLDDQLKKTDQGKRQDFNGLQIKDLNQNDFELLKVKKEINEKVKQFANNIRLKMQIQKKLKGEMINGNLRLKIILICISKRKIVIFQNQFLDQNDNSRGTYNDRATIFSSDQPQNQKRRKKKKDTKGGPTPK